MIENDKNLTCDFGEEIVLYLYDEMASAEKIRFEKHLKICTECTDEIVEFSLARTSVSEWREIEFAPLATPKIEIPYQPKQVVKLADTGVSKSWLAKIRDFLTLSPAWMTATTAAAALVICLGLLAVLFSNSRINDDFVQSNVKVIPTPTTETKDKKSDVSETNLPAPISADELPKSVENNPNSRVVKPIIPVKTTTAGSKIVKSQNLTVIKNSPPKIETKSNKINTKNVDKKAPSLIDNDDDEDDSLRLSDLLEEVSLK